MKKKQKKQMLKMQGRKIPATGWAQTTGALFAFVLCCGSLLPGAGRAQAATVQTQSQSGQPTPKERAVKAGREEESKPAARGSSESPFPNVLVSPDEDYRIGPKDVLEVRVEDAPELSGSYPVNASGAIQMPYLGKILAHKKTAEELAKLIAEGLRERYLLDPQVTVSVRQYNSRSFFIHGAVRGPGVFQIEGKPPLLELIILAGGLAPDHGSSAYIIRKTKMRDLQQLEATDALASVANDAGQHAQKAETKPAGDTLKADLSAADKEPTPAEEQVQYTMHKVNLNLLLSGRFDQNITLQPGDIINIPPTDVFFVAGEVLAPGSFPLKEGTSLRQAISLAQGTTFEAASARGIIYRETSEGKTEEIQIDIGSIMKGKKADIILKANDIVMVPNSKMKSVVNPVLSAFGMMTVTRVPGVGARR